MFITADLLLDAIFLLLNDNSTRNQQAVLELIKLYKEESKNMEPSDGDLMRFYVRVLNKIIEDNIDKTNTQALRTFMLKFKSDPAFDRNREVMDLLQDAVSSRDTLSADQLKKLADRVQTILLWHQTNKIVRKNFAKLNRCSELASSEAQQAEILAVLNSSADYQNLFQNSVQNGAISDAIDCINFQDRDSIKKGLKRQTARNVTGRIRTGLQGLNRMLGKSGGIVAGESVVFNALPHMYKSGILVSMAIWAVVYNIPVTTDGTRPMVYLASLENEAYQNMFWVFRQRYHVETGQSPSGLTDDQIEEWLYTYFAKHGCTLIIERFMPHNFGFNEYMARVSYFKQQGFSIVMAIIDYANLMRKDSDDKSSSGGGRDLNVRHLFSKLCNFNKNLGIAFVTAHPLNRDAMKTVANQTNVVRRLGPDHLADSVDVEREVDVSIYMHLESNTADQKFLTMRINKHRYVDDTPEKHKICAYQFTELGVGILDDLGKAPRFVTDIYEVNFDGVQANTQALQLETAY